MSDRAETTSNVPTEPAPRALYGFIAVIAVLYVVAYARAAYDLYINWTLVDSYYTHGFLVPFISLYFVWRQRNALRAAPGGSSLQGVLWVLGALGLQTFGTFLGFRVFTQISMVVMLTGLSLLLLGKARTRLLWFPIAFLLFMVPIPPSLTQSISLKVKLLATESAVQLANLVMLPMVREGSYVHFGDDKLLVGEVCGGLRSLIALLALGALMAYLSKARAWARIALFILAAPVAIISNVLRIFLLCAVGYFWGSRIAAGTFHDVSGIFIYVVAFACFFLLETLFRRLFPAAPVPVASSTVTSNTPFLVFRPKRYLLCTVALAATVAITLGIEAQRARAVEKRESSESVLKIPSQIAQYHQVGEDIEIEQHVKDVLETSDILVRNYASTSSMVQLTIVYAGTTRRSLHFPEVCLVGAGWEIRDQKSINVGFTFSARQLVLVRGERRQAVLYFFKTGEELTGNYFLNAWYWAKNQITFGQSTSAMIKVAAPISVRGEEATFAVLDDFAMKFAPVLLESVP